MDPVAEILILIDRINYVRMKISRKRSVEFYPLDPGRGNGSQESRERRRTLEQFHSRVGLRTIAVNVLADEMDFLNARAAGIVGRSEVHVHRAFVPPVGIRTRARRRSGRGGNRVGGRGR